MLFAGKAGLQSSVKGIVRAVMEYRDCEVALKDEDSYNRELSLAI